jgi:antitoxin ParD1/3/4
MMAKNDKNCHNHIVYLNKCLTAMTSINISLPESMKAYVEEQVARGGYSTASEYLRELIRQDQKRKATERLETLLLEGLESGTATAMTSQDWEQIRHEVQKRVAQRQNDING